MGEMPDSDFLLDFDIGEEWPLIVDSEREYTVLIRCRERSAVDGAVSGIAG